MNKLILGAALALTATSPALAQSAQEQLDQRYDRALAAGYKALFLCSAIANAETNGTSRTPESVHQWELTGIYPALDPIIRDMPYEIVRRPNGLMAHVQVKWAADMPDRLAVYYGAEAGCTVLPIGVAEGFSNPQDNTNEPAVQEAHAGFGEGAASARLARTLDEQFSAAIEGDYGENSRTTALVVIDGDAAAERYAEGFDANTPQRTWSVAKSIAATLVGNAVHSGEVMTSDPVGLNYWRAGGSSDPRNLVTIDHALRMATGRYSDTPGNRTDPLYWGGTTVDERAANWPLIHPPGTVFRYANNDTLMAVKAIGARLAYYKPHEFFEAVGMRHTVAEADIRDNYVLSSQVWSTARDLARLGQLHLRDGVWNGERLLPEGWVEYISSPSGPQPEGRGWGYGAGWWLLNQSDGVPSDTFFAAGNRGQYIVVVPSRNVVIVRRGEDMVGTRFDIEAFTRDVLAALD